MIDGKRIRTLRRQRNLTQRDLAKAIGRTTSVVRSLELGQGAAGQPLHVLKALAAALAVDEASLLMANSPEERQPDHATMEAALAAIGRGASTKALAEGLGWTLRRTREALQAARTAHEGTGIRIQHHAGRWKLVPALDLIPDALAERVHRADVGTRGLTTAQARVLYAVMKCRVDERWYSNASIDQQNQLARLKRLGYVLDDEPRWRLAPSVRDALGLR